MIKNPAIVTALGTLYLIVYVTLIYNNAPLSVVGVLFTCSPIVVIWMAYTILKFGKYEGRTLEENEHWGYQDKPMKLASK